jgi:endonuclease YncB( thermonuclease family)
MPIHTPPNIPLCLFLAMSAVSAMEMVSSNIFSKGVVYTNVRPLRVVDGDTVVIPAPYLPPPLEPELAVRIYGVDTPEKGFRAKCAIERRRGEAATRFTEGWLAAAKAPQLVLFGWDKYGGRVLGDFWLPNQTSLRASLLARGLAREYFGETKPSWCA